MKHAPFPTSCHITQSVSAKCGCFYFFARNFFILHFLILQVVFILKTIELPTLWYHYNFIIVKKKWFAPENKNSPKKFKKKWENILPLLKNKKWVVEYPYICAVKRSHTHKLHTQVKIGGKIQFCFTIFLGRHVYGTVTTISTTNFWTPITENSSIWSEVEITHNS